ncbi:MAG: hypothetical protein ABW061_28145 [Polyangiaceae bacterium]
MSASSRWARSFAVGSLSLFVLFGCASIIGLDDYTVAGQAGAAGNAGQAGTAGKAGQSGVSGEAGASNGGDAGSAGEGGEGGTTQGGTSGNPGGGKGGDAGAAGQPAAPIVGCDGVTEFEPNEQVITSCIIRAGCSPNAVPVRTISTCVTYDTQQALPGETCTRNATTCAEYDDCEHNGIAHDDLCGGSKVTRCEGNIAVNCDNYDTDQFSDCDALGGTCATYDYFGTIYADCKLDVTPDTTCATETDDTKFFCHSSTKEDFRYYCFDGEAYGATCTQLATCEDDTTPGNASCYFDLPSCSGSSVTCKNNIANDCSGGSLFKYDCDAMGLTCGIANGTEYCLAPGCTTKDVDTKCTESCSDDGTKLTFCYGGTPYTVDCANYGFSQCLSDTDSDGNPYSACRF